MDVIFSNIISITFGGIVGFLIANHFYRKSKPFEQHMRSITHSIEEIYLSTKYPTVFQSQLSVRMDYRNLRPSNKDIPHLMEVCSETNKVRPNQELFILFRMIDEGMNLRLTSGVEVRNNLNNYNIPVIFEGFGWCSCRVKIPSDVPIGSQKLTFNFRDIAGNTNCQEYTYNIIEDKI
jgi:hypothetical protein